MKFLFSVADVFELQDRCVLLPSAWTDNDTRIRAKDRIQLHTPAGHRFDTYVWGIDILCGKEVRQHTALSLPPEFKKADIPAGTEVWLHDCE